MLKIGVTGGIGCGKSTVATLFSEQYNIPIIDADIISRQLVEPKQPALLQIQKEFSSAVIAKDGTLNRAELMRLIFVDPDKKRALEDILHPLVYQKMQEIFATQVAPYCLFSIPLLMETKIILL